MATVVEDFFSASANQLVSRCVIEYNRRNRQHNPIALVEK